MGYTFFLKNYIIHTFGVDKNIIVLNKLLLLLYKRFNN
jgi:hypothetical protein